MSMKRIDGNYLAQKLYERIKKDVALLGFEPVFCDVLVGDNLASMQYVRMKEKRARDVGMKVHHAHFDATITTDELCGEIEKLNEIPYMCGLIVQLPLPAHIDTQAVLNAIDPRHDVDVLHEETSAAFYANTSHFVFPTARAIMHIIDHVPLPYDEKKFLVIGQGRLVGAPVTHLLRQRNYNVTTLTQNDENPVPILRRSDIIISATGNDGLITGEKIMPGVMLIDAGTSESHGGIKGDVDLASVGEKPSYISGVPGGVGPITVAMLLDNVVHAARAKYL